MVSGIRLVISVLIPMPLTCLMALVFVLFQ